MADIELYRDSGLKIYEMAHYSRGEQIRETEMILSWYRRKGSRILDIGCSGGLHTVELAKKGHSLTGIDREISAIELARERCVKPGLKAEFFVADLEKDDLVSLGKFDLIICIGNVISHIAKKSLPDVLKKIRSCLGNDGIFLFDVLAAGNPFPEEVREEDLGIIWKRKLDRSSGKITMTGIFGNFGITAGFDLWGFTREEILAMVMEADFAGADISGRLDFPKPDKTAENPVCLRCRARANLHAAT
jgi:SAM-dependent methyltransferase